MSEKTNHVERYQLNALSTLLNILLGRMDA